MPVIIRDLDKPEECCGCRFCLQDHGRDYCVFDGEYIDWADGTVNLDCPLEEYKEPERKTGHWVYDENGMDWNLPAWVCSECHGRNGMIPTYIWGKDKTIKVEHPLMWAGSKYCPNCGAKMEADHE